MTWDEDWLSTERVTPEELTSYSLLPNRQAWKIFLYYSILGGGFYFILEIVGNVSRIILGLPILLWAGMLMVVLFLIGLYTLIRIPEKKRGGIS